MTPAGLIALSLAGLLAFAVLAAFVLTRFVPGPEDGKPRLRWGTDMQFDHEARKWRSFLVVEEEE